MTTIRKALPGLRFRGASDVHVEVLVPARWLDMKTKKDTLIYMQAAIRRGTFRYWWKVGTALPGTLIARAMTTHSAYGEGMSPEGYDRVVSDLVAVADGRMWPVSGAVADRTYQVIGKHAMQLDNLNNESLQYLREQVIPD